MNGVHDMGGMQGLGPIEPEPHEPVFHEPWEARVFALVRAMGAWKNGILTPRASNGSRFRPPNICG